GPGGSLGEGAAEDARDAPRVVGRALGRRRTRRVGEQPDSVGGDPGLDGDGIVAKPFGDGPQQERERAGLGAVERGAARAREQDPEVALTGFAARRELARRLLEARARLFAGARELGGDRRLARFWDVHEHGPLAVGALALRERAPGGQRGALSRIARAQEAL